LRGAPKEKPEPVGRTSREFETESIDLQRKAQQLKNTQKNLEEIVCGGACIAAGLGLLATVGSVAAPAVAGMAKGKPKPGSGGLMKGNKISQQTQQIVQNKNTSLGKIGPGQQKLAASYDPEEIRTQRILSLQERVHNLQEIGFLAPLLGGLARVGAGAAKVGAGAAKVGAGVARAGAGAARGVAGAGRAAGASLRNVAGKIKPKIRPKINAPVVKPTSPLGAKPVVKPVGAKPVVKPVGAKPSVKSTIPADKQMVVAKKPVHRTPSNITKQSTATKQSSGTKSSEGNASKSAGDAAAQPKGKEGLLKRGAKAVGAKTGEMLPYLALGAMGGGGGKPDNRTDVSHPTGSAR